MVPDDSVQQPTSRLTLKAIWELARDSFNEWQQDNAPRLAAALTYYTIFAMAPMLVIIVAVAGLVLGQNAAQGQLYLEAQKYVGDEGSKVLQGLVENTTKPGAGLAATVVGLVILFIGAS